MFVVSLLCARQVFPEIDNAISVKASNYNILNVENNTNENTLRNSREQITLFEWNFESELWNSDAGWILTESDYNSETHSYQSPNDASTLGSTWNLVSDVVTLPPIGEGEVMQFDFWLRGDTPDTDGDGDGFLEDYYQLSIMDLNALAWHASSDVPDDPDNEGASYWCADETIGPDGGYLDEWMQYLDTPTISVNPGDALFSQIKFEIEDYAGAVVAGSCTDGWDAANVRISADGGDTWELLVDPRNPYDFDCGYGWIYNDSEYETGGSLNQVAAGWGGSSSGWIDFEADLSPWAGQDVIIRYAFGSDPAYNTNDQTDMTGFQVDNITVGSFLDDCDGSTDSNSMIPSGEVWEAMFYDYLACEDERPGACGDWEQYVPGLAFNGNVLHDISHLAGKNVLIKFTSRYDDNDDGGVGAGIFIDDFRIYKESSGNYPAPENLTAESGDGEVMLEWQDMNLSGTFDYDFTNNTPLGGITMNGESTSYAGEKYDIAGESTVESIEIFNINAANASVTIAGFSRQGSLYSSDPLYTMEVNLPLANDWNTIDLSGMGWTFTNGFILAHTFDNVVSAALDETAIPSTNSMILFQGGSWDTWANSAAGSGGAVGDGEWGIKSTITQSGAGVTYNVQRDGVQVASGIETYMYTDTGLINNSVYTYTVSATYPDGTESDPSESVEVTPQAQTVHQESWDDGTAEVEWNPDGSGQLAAVRFSAHDAGEQLIRFHWYQVGDGGAFYVKVWEDDNGMPGSEVLSLVQVAGNTDGWNVRDLVAENLDVTCDFWIGMKRFSSSMPIGIDTSSDSGNSMNSDDGTAWNAVGGNIMFMVDIDAGEEGGEPCVLSNTDDMIPSVFEVSNAYPNPFNPSTTIDINIPESGLLNVGVYNLKGQLMSTLINEDVYPGSYSLAWDASNLTSGLYIFSVSYGDKTYNQKVTLVK